jgi:hypothetical protein
MFSIAAVKGAIAGEAYQRALSSKICLGSPEDSLNGVTNMPGRQNITAAAAWSTLTAAQICDQIILMYDAIHDGTAGAFVPDTCVLPHSMRALFKKQNSVAANTSIEQFLKDSYPEITKWVYDHSMATAGAGGSKCVAMFVRDRKVMAAIVPEYIRPLVARPVGLGWMIPFKSRFAGIRCTNPGSVCTMHGI